MTSPVSTSYLRVLIPALAFALTWSTVAAARDLEPRPFADDPALADLPARWQEHMEVFNVPGAAVVIVRDGDVYVHTFGVRDPEGSKPVTPDTMFYIASITKTFNAMALCAMQDDGMLSLDDPVRKHLQRFNLPEGHEDLEQTITVRDLLCHRYGINSPMIVALDAYSGDITEDRYWYWLEHAGTVAGETQYTNVNFTLAGKVIESASGMDWRDWLDQRIFKPAGMTRTTGYASRLYNDADCAIPLEWTEGGFVPTAQRKTDRTMHAAGGLGISALDAARWIMLNLHQGTIQGRRIISDELARAMQSEQSTHDPRGTIRIEEGFGLGWHRGHYVDAPMLSHGGGYVGTYAYVGLHPDQEAGFFVLVNASGPPSAWGTAVAVDCSRALTGMDPPWEPWERYTKQMAERDDAGDDENDPDANAVTSAHLSRPVGLYTGRFYNQWMGTAIVTRDGDRLSFSLGDSPRELVVGDEADTFIVSGMPGRFYTTAGGEVDRLGLTLPGDLGEYIFER